MNPTPLLLTGILIVSGALGAASGALGSPGDEPPPGVEQILPRGRIAAVFAPTFVSAEEAGIPGDAWVLGVEVDGAAKAYSLNLLNRHEVVNDTVGEKSFAAVW